MPKKTLKVQLFASHNKEDNKRSWKHCSNIMWSFVDSETTLVLFIIYVW